MTSIQFILLFVFIPSLLSHFILPDSFCNLGEFSIFSYLCRLTSSCLSYLIYFHSSLIFLFLVFSRLIIINRSNTRINSRRSFSNDHFFINYFSTHPKFYQPLSLSMSYARNINNQKRINILIFGIISRVKISLSAGIPTSASFNQIES